MNHTLFETGSRMTITSNPLCRHYSKRRPRYAAALKNRVVALLLALTVALGVAAQPAAAGGWVYCAGGPDGGVLTWGYSSSWASHGHIINGYIRFLSGVYTSVSHPAPPSTSDVAASRNTWDVTNVNAEGRSCWILV